MVKRNEHKVEEMAKRSRELSRLMGQGVDNMMHKEIIEGLHVRLSKTQGLLPDSWSDEKCLLTLHKYRYEMKWVDAEKRHASRHWLQQRNYHRLKMEPWPEEGKFPEDT